MVGTFLAFDRHMNLVLSHTEEYRLKKNSKEDLADVEEKRPIGLILLRGENVVSLQVEAPPQAKKQQSTQKPTGTAVPVSSRAPVGLGRGVNLASGNNGINLPPSMSLPPM
eukprot:augustus_masked-scaffold_6-processed-gene-11.13-mRNA-1 protein AED:0.11 eAED:0.11 QI:0/-1/0/1/-1/1/1/0/110